MVREEIKPLYSISRVRAVEERVRREIEEIVKKDEIGKRVVALECIEIKLLRGRLVCSYGVAVIEDDNGYSIEIIRERRNSIGIGSLAFFDREFKVTWYCCERNGLVSICPAIRSGTLEFVIATDIMTLLKHLGKYSGGHAIVGGDPTRHAKAFLTVLKYFSEVVRVNDPGMCPCEGVFKLYEVLERLPTYPIGLPRL